MNDNIKSKIKLKRKLYHSYLKHIKNNDDFAKLEDLRSEVDKLISKFKGTVMQII